MENRLEYFKIGKIVTTRGLKGELKIYSHTDDVERFLELEKFYIGNDRNTEYEVEKASVTSGNTVIIKIKGYDRVEDVQRFIGKFIFVDRDNSYELDDDEMFIADMIGMDVVRTTGERIGRLEDVLQYSANDVYVVKSDEGKEYLIPATYEIVPEINREERTMTVNVIPGLLD